MTSPKDGALDAVLRADAELIVESRLGPPTIDRKYTIIGTSGSTDYLLDVLDVGQYRPTRQDRRFWFVSVPCGEPTPDDAAPDDWQFCDGLHEKSAPSQYLCLRCFPDLRGDLTESQEDEYDEARRDDDEEME